MIRIAGRGQLLLQHGAEIDPRRHAWHDADLLGVVRTAAHGGPASRVSRDVWTLVPAGKLDRLREVLTAEPRLATVSWEGGTPLFSLPDDEDRAAEIVELFLAHGADPSFRRRDGTTAAQIARARGLDAAAELLAARPRPEASRYSVAVTRKRSSRVTRSPPEIASTASRYAPGTRPRAARREGSSPVEVDGPRGRASPQPRSTVRAVQADTWRSR